MPGKRDPLSPDAAIIESSGRARYGGVREEGMYRRRVMTSRQEKRSEG